MKPEHEKRFMEIVERERLRVHVMDELRELIDDVSSSAFDDGVARIAKGQKRGG